MPAAGQPLPKMDNSFVLPRHKVVYVSVAKVACTSMRWMVADLAGEDLESFRQMSGGGQSRLMNIHGHRSRFKHSTSMNHLPPDQVAQISGANGWFVFGLVRNPYSRLWSAWQSKFLVRHNRYLRDYGEEPFFPRVPSRASDVVEDFARFVEMSPWTSHPMMATDKHFHTQVSRLRMDEVPYTAIYDLSDFGTMVADLHAHLRTVGLDQELYFPRANETPLTMTREVFGGGVREAIEKLYADDFDAFGDRWEFDRLTFAPDGWTPDAISHVRYHTVANDWIGHVNATGKEWKAERNQLARRLRRARQRNERLRRRNRRLRAKLGRLQARRGVSGWRRRRG